MFVLLLGVLLLWTPVHGATGITEASTTYDGANLVISLLVDGSSSATAADTSDSLEVTLPRSDFKVPEVVGTGKVTATLALATGTALTVNDGNAVTIAFEEGIFKLTFTNSSGLIPTPTAADHKVTVTIPLAGQSCDNTKVISGVNVDYKPTSGTAAITVNADNFTPTFSAACVAAQPGDNSVFSNFGAFATHHHLYESVKSANPLTLQFEVVPSAIKTKDLKVSVGPISQCPEPAQITVNKNKQAIDAGTAKCGYSNGAATIYFPAGNAVIDHKDVEILIHGFSVSACNMEVAVVDTRTYGHIVALRPTISACSAGASGQSGSNINLNIDCSNAGR